MNVMRLKEEHEQRNSYDNPASSASSAGSTMISDMETIFGALAQAMAESKALKEENARLKGKLENSTQDVNASESALARTSSQLEGIHKKQLEDARQEKSVSEDKTVMAELQRQLGVLKEEFELASDRIKTLTECLQREMAESKRLDRDYKMLLSECRGEQP